MSVDQLIKSNYNNLTKSEKKAAKYALDNKDKMYTMTLHEYSQGCGIGEATVMRFVKKLGYDTLGEFKMAVASLTLKERDNAESEDPLELFQSDINELTKQTLLANSQETLDKAVDLIENANHLVFLGNGTSGYVSQLIAYRFMRAGRECEHVEDVHYSEIRSALLKKGDVLVTISHSGDNVDVIRPTIRARQNGCSIITMTSYRTTKLQEFADVALFNSPGPIEHRIYGVGTRIVINQEFLAEMLYIIYKERHLDEVLNHQKLTAISTSTHHVSLDGES